MSHLVYRVVTHSQKVCRLYKKCLKQLEFWHPERSEFRYEATLMRARFEKNRHIKDQRLAHQLLVDGEEELFQNTHPIPWNFPKSPGGAEYGDDAFPADSILDYWHPEEKALYPDYFARRHKRKEEWVKFWQENYANVPKMDEVTK